MLYDIYTVAKDIGGWIVAINGAIDGIFETKAQANAYVRFDMEQKALQEA